MAKKINVDQLRIGMFVEALDRPWRETPFLLEGVAINEPSDIEALTRLCRYVYITADEQETHACNAAQLTKLGHSGLQGDVARARPPFAVEEVEEARNLRRRARVAVDTMQEDAAKQQIIDAEGAKILVDDMAASIMDNPDALLWLTQLKKKDEYTANHSVNVSILAMVFGHHLGVSGSPLRELGLGALMHDIGKLRVPLAILNKPGQLDQRESQEMRKHPVYGLQILHATKVLPRAVTVVAYAHHERYSGGGYPRGLALNEDKDFYSQIVTIVDIYDALTSDRPYKSAMPLSQALKLMQQWRGQNFHPQLIDRFVECLGLFPSGSLVEMNTGEVGLIVPSRRGKQGQPIIMLILDQNKKKYYPLKIVDFKLFEQSASPYRIKAVLAPGAYGIEPIEYTDEIVSIK